MGIVSTGGYRRVRRPFEDGMADGGGSGWGRRARV